MHQSDPGDEWEPAAPLPWRFDRHACPYCGNRKKVHGPRRGKRWNDDRMMYCDRCSGKWFQYETDELNVDPTKGDE